jgi:hypothetical protein
MVALAWDQVGDRLFETGVDHGVLYQIDDTGLYVDGVAWNGLTTVTESPSGAESSPQYADNILYVNLVSAELFGGTIEAFTYPDEFGQNDGSASPAAGVSLGQQGRRPFGFSYRSLIGNDVENTEYGYKLHLVYGAQAAPSEKARATVNDSPEATPFSWELTTTPVGVDGTNPVTGKPYKPTSHITIDSTTADADALAELEAILYGDEATDPRLPLPNEVIALFEGTTTDVRLTGANAPTYNSGTHVVTLPAVTGVTWTVNGVTKTAGAQPAMTVGQTSVVVAHPTAGYAIDGDDDWTFDY